MVLIILWMVVCRISHANCSDSTTLRAATALLQLCTLIVSEQELYHAARAFHFFSNALPHSGMRKKVATLFFLFFYVVHKYEICWT